MDNVPQSTGRVLRSTEEVQQEQADTVVEASLAVYWATLLEESKDVAIRFDPRPKPMKREPESLFFFSGNGKSNSRVMYRRKRYDTWSRT